MEGAFRGFCNVCDNDKDPDDGVLITRCGCFYCAECLEEAFQAAVKERSWVGFQCCYGGVTFDMARLKLSKGLQRQFRANEVEIKTKNKIYCHKPRCSTFIKPQSVHNGNGYCQKCRAVTCAKCKNERHDGPCSLSASQRVLQEVGQRRGWRKCPDCPRVIERNGGCNHMQCPCGTEFCYRCGLRRTACRCVGEAEDEEEEEEDEF